MQNRLPEKLWTINDLANFLQVKSSVIKYWIYNSDIPYIKLGKHYRFDPEDVYEWIDKARCMANDDILRLRTLVDQ